MNGRGSRVWPQWAEQAGRCIASLILHSRRIVLHFESQNVRLVPRDVRLTDGGIGEEP